ncbi:hypothetical protein Tsubulata_007461 [Turnera subulata]|uniref:Growth-regulating factor n=1 Tax=Turnera subulata TaxID=218843 RepID=A0A9Q0JMH2_9ROSI|nr:hypothetical protein Tsubulata_007461 [Turnera subulata]
MDFGVLGLEGFVGPEANAGGALPAPHHHPHQHHVSPPETRAKVVGSGLVKQERSSAPSQDDWRTSKMPKTEDFSASKAMPLHHHHQPPLLRSASAVSPDTGRQEHMLSFSSAKAEAAAPFLSKDTGLADRSLQNHSSFAYQHPSPSAYTRIAGYSNGSLNASVHGPFTGVRGPFTPSQWMELEHQALIYKYITANVAVPSNLLIPVKKSLCSYGFSGSSAGSYPHNSLGWGAFHLAYPGNTTDPEPGRCRRTDGKKWRCSRDAVADQKYCERHINRGRHRSRKPVEGQSGHAATGTTNSKVGPMTTSMSTSVIASGGVSNSLVISQQQFKNLQPPAANSSAGALVNRVQDPRGVSIVSPSINLKPDESNFGVPKQQAVSIDESPQTEFGLVTSDSLLNPSQRTHYLNSKSYESYLNFGDQEAQDQHPLRQFIDDWPKDPSSRSVISWPEELKSDWTQLSMSIPMASTDFSSSSSSPAQEKLTLSPLRLSREYDPIQMGLGVSSDPSEASQKQTTWIPISWGTSMGGPLGEVLSTTSGKGGSFKNSSALNLLTEGWDGSPQMGSSPTGVLQKSTFASLSNSSSGSSPRAEGNKNNKLCDDLLGTTIASSS